MGRVAGLLLGLLLGMGGAVLLEVAPSWSRTAPVLLAGACLLACAVLVRVHAGMSRFERGHDERAEAFRLAMLAEHAPHLLERGAAL
jgi:hypothetical protein